MNCYLTLLSLFLVICTVKSEDFDIFVYAQQWPQSVCIGSKLSHEHKCKIDSGVSTWTVHGLWPTKLHEHPPGPNFCDKSAKFDEKQVDGIMNKLLKYWPNLYKEEPLDSLWEHEWVKHGTCAKSLEALNSELKYFTNALSLNAGLFNLTAKLENNGIVPSDTETYPYRDVRMALGSDVKMQCYYDKAKKTQYIAQVELCVSKDLTRQISCNGSEIRRKRSLDSLLTSQQSSQTVVRMNGFESKYKQIQDIRMEDCYDTEEIAYPKFQYN